MDFHEISLSRSIPDIRTRVSATRPLARTPTRPAAEVADLRFAGGAQLLAELRNAAFESRIVCGSPKAMAGRHHHQVNNANAETARAPRISRRAKSGVSKKMSATMAAMAQASTMAATRRSARRGESRAGPKHRRGFFRDSFGGCNARAGEAAMPGEKD